MGSCVSVHKDPGSASKVRIVFGSKADKVVVIPSPVKEKIMVNGDDVKVNNGFGLKSQPPPPALLHDYGSKEETFFDSQPWLESDCEDDFLSVNGDFTPSRGNTPINYGFSPGNARTNRATPSWETPGSVPEPSPKKKLSELFKERLDNETDMAEQDGEVQEGLINLPPKHVSPTEPYASKGDSRDKRRTKSEKPAQCCLPKLRSARASPIGGRG